MDDRGGSFVAVRRISQTLERGNTCQSTSVVIIPQFSLFGNFTKYRSLNRDRVMFEKLDHCASYTCMMLADIPNRIGG